MSHISSITRLRFRQIRFLAKTLEHLSCHSQSRKILAALGSNSLLDHCLSGFRRTFSSFEEARLHAGKYRVPSHEHPDNISIHSYRTEEVRESDYPVLFHMQRLMGEVNSVLDIGGSIGNLFYGYSKYLSYPPGMTWTVCEVPDTIIAGSHLAQQRNEHRLRFVERIQDCDAVDAVIISGALHYFEQLPPALIEGLRRQPRHVFINRTPVIYGPSAFTIQDHEQYFAISPARVLSHEVLLEAMYRAGYELVDEWKANELRLHIPLHPEASVSAYSGFYFRMKQAGAVRHPQPTREILKRVMSTRRTSRRIAGVAVHSG
ncbi:putative methyltransferase (TIGR04325 family) [Granulicella aggregans]|uniref:Putative methyltransferase (TIGR04325 family) n=1 Tax=Granulicella aggregans TaxID=474949 RepID=A0A7W8E548_9BACT|nr:methyltransferase, TIGR04325 family [Granulicella aggregans]MBB5057845.1 putative methyltransferase (TIGR04325 family) [Granulicella aggregans]